MNTLNVGPVRVSDYMRILPYTIGVEIPAEEALRRMREHGIRHLPVLKGGKVVGIITDRDLNLIRNLPGGLAQKVGEIMTEETYTVSAKAELADVIAEMANRKYGAAVVTGEKGEVTGIFTTIDAMQVLYEALKFGRIP